MSLRYMSRVVVQTARAIQGGIRERATKSVKDTTTKSQKVRQLTGASNPKPPVTSGEDQKRKRAEEALRTVMFLSVWGPN